MGKTDQPTSRSPLTPSPGRPAEATPPFDPYAEIVQIARRTPSRSRFMAEVCRCIVRAFASPYGAVHVRYASEVIQDDSHAGPTDPNFWKAGLQEFLTESLAEGRSRAKLFKSKQGEAKVAFLSAPIFDPSGPAIGAMAIVAPVIEESDWSTRLVTLEALCRFASHCAEFLGRASTSAPGVAGADRAIARAAACGTVEELAFSITNELRNKLGCEQVALSLVVRNRARIVSISGLDQINRRSPGVAGLRAAMEECLDAGTPIHYHRAGDWSDDGTSLRYHLHRQWHATAKGDSVASLPLRVGDRSVAILSLRGKPEQPFTQERLTEIQSRVEPFAPALLLADRASRGVMRHAIDAGRAGIDGLTAPGHRGRKVGLGFAVAATLAFFFGSMNYEVTVPCVVTPAQARHLSAPFAGVILAAYAFQGDRVHQGDVLCVLDHRELDQQRLELTAQLDVHEREKDRAMAGDAPVEVQLALANQRLVRAKLDIVTSRIERATLRAPIDGVVVAGDLRAMIGGLVSQGDPLFQVAQPDHWRLELDVPESAAAELAAGLPGSFAGHARPADRHEFRITRVMPAAQLRKNRNVYVAEADIDGEHAGIRPGMEGVAKIRVGERAIWWIATHRVLDYLRLHLWL